MSEKKSKQQLRESRSHSFHGKADRKSSASRLRRDLKDQADPLVSAPLSSVASLSQQQKQRLSAPHSEDARSYEDLCEFSGSAVYANIEETVRQGARSILLTEDNLTNFHGRSSQHPAAAAAAAAPPDREEESRFEPDLIQDLPR